MSQHSFLYKSVFSGFQSTFENETGTLVGTSSASGVVYVPKTDIIVSKSTQRRDSFEKVSDQTTPTCGIPTKTGSIEKLDASNGKRSADVQKTESDKFLPKRRISEAKLRDLAGSQAATMIGHGSSHGSDLPIKKQPSVKPVMKSEDLPKPKKQHRPKVEPPTSLNFSSFGSGPPKIQKQTIENPVERRDGKILVKLHKKPVNRVDEAVQPDLDLSHGDKTKKQQPVKWETGRNEDRLTFPGVGGGFGGGGFSRGGAPGDKSLRNVNDGQNLTTRNQLENAASTSGFTGVSTIHYFVDT